jgi:hypothetical protein
VIGVTRHRYRSAALVLAVVLSGMGLFVVWPTTGRGQVEARVCESRVLPGVLPVWARAGFSDPKPRMPHVLSAAGKLTAILFAYPLLSPPPKSHTNKILWVSRAAVDPASALRISAQRMNGSIPVGSSVARRVTGGPGPSIINLPASGCWRFTLRWSGQLDTLDLVYRANR